MEKKKYTYGYSKEDFKKFTKFAWLMILSFGLMYLFFYNGRQNINLVKLQMRDALGTSDAAMGVITSSLFWCYAFGQLISGRLGAFFGYKRIMAFGVVASAILNVVISFQHSVPVIAVLWGLNGFFQSTVWANGLGVVAKWWPKDKRGFSSGFATAFTGMAQVVTYLTILLCVDGNDPEAWRSAFRYPMIPMVLSLVAFIFLFKEKPEDVGLAPFEEEDKEAQMRDLEMAKQIEEKGFFYPYKVLFSETKVIIFCFIAAIAGVGRYGLLEQVPSYFTESLGLSIKEGIFSAIVLPIGQTCAMFLFPLITDKVFKGKREPMLVIASIVTFFGMIAFPFIKSQLPASIMLFVVAVSAMVTGVIWAIAADMGGRAFSSTVVGVLDWAVYMGAALQSLLFGFAKNIFGWPAIFITIGCLYIILLGLTFVAKKVKTKRI